MLTPVIVGSGRGSTSTILAGLGLVAASIIFAPAGAGFFGLGMGVGSSVTATWSSTAFTYVTSISSVLSSGASIALGTIGTTLILGGVSQMLAPQPPIDSLQNRSKPGQNTNATGPQGVSRATSGEQSYAFSGPANTVGVGATVPLVYGKLLIGSHLISSKVEVTSESDPTGEFFEPPGPESITINSEKVGNKFASLNGLRTRRYEDSQVKIVDIGNSRRAPNMVVKFDSTAKNTITNELDDTTSNRRKNLQILIEINKGLSRVIGNQTVPAFVTYEITVTKQNYPGESPTFATVRATVQGLLRKSDNYKYCHAITYGTSGTEDGDTVIAPAIRIIDTDADAGQQLVVRGIGYKHFYKEGQNNTEGLSDS